jgi:hypothetical protein
MLGPNYTGPAPKVKSCLLARARAPEQLLADGQIGAANLERQVGGDIAHQAVAQVGIAVTQLEQALAVDDQEMGLF